MLEAHHYRTIILSDVHLGTQSSKAKELVRFLKKNTCDTLILNGDIVDGWRLKRSGRWKKKHTRFFKVIIKMMQRIKTEVIYIRGNHDDFLDTMMPLSIGNLSIKKDYVLRSNGKRFYVVHGDVFDAVTTNLKWLAKIGDIGYSILLWVNKIYNNRRVRKGLPYYSLSQAIKQKVKSAVSYISDFEEELCKLARSRHCDGIICGHIHHASISAYDGIMYMNSGDWVESLTALTEDYEGNWNIVYYNDLKEAEKDPKKETETNSEESQQKIKHPEKKPVTEVALTLVAK